MDSLPVSNSLPVQYLAASFDNVTNSYKFYWFLSILEHIHHKQTRVIPVQQLIARMIANVWYPTNYFRLSFGKQDRLGAITINIGAQTSLPADSKQNQIIDTVLEFLRQDSLVAQNIESLQAYVPYRFLRPFFAGELRGIKDTLVNSRIESMAREAYSKDKNPCLYKFISSPETAIEIHPAWFEYLKQHLSILTGFCMWNLVGYIQKNNPNVPNISSKLIEPSQRDLKAAREFWKVAFDKLGTVSCIYSEQQMTKSQFSLDHFLPWRFVAHDLLWNIIPSPKNVNSAKSDNLPDTGKYFEKFTDAQYKAVKIVAQEKKPALLEDYFLLTKVSSLDDFESMSYENFRTMLSDTISPQFQIAENMGFLSRWIYRGEDGSR